MLEFETAIDGVLVNGVDIITWNDAGRISEFKVMLRPLKGIDVIHQKMGEMLAAVQKPAPSAAPPPVTTRPHAVARAARRLPGHRRAAPAAGSRRAAQAALRALPPRTHALRLRAPRERAHARGRVPADGRVRSAQAEQHRLAGGRRRARHAGVRVVAHARRPGAARVARRPALAAAGRVPRGVRGARARRRHAARGRAGRGRRPLFILLDGTWADARKAFRKSPFLDRFPVLSLAPERLSRYRLRAPGTNTTCARPRSRHCAWRWPATCAPRARSKPGWTCSANAPCARSKACRRTSAARRTGDWTTCDGQAGKAPTSRPRQNERPRCRICCPCPSFQPSPPPRSQWRRPRQEPVGLRRLACVAATWPGDRLRGCCRKATGVCPPRPGAAVTQIDIFDGDPAERAYLAPDDAMAGTNIYSVKSVYDAGRMLTVRCHYGEARPTSG